MPKSGQGVPEHHGQRIFDLGEKPPQANAAKLIVNFNIAAAIECMAEAFTLAEKTRLHTRQKQRKAGGGMP